MITEASIREDLAVFEQRIQATKDKLAALPVSYNYKDRKKLKVKQRALEAELVHVRGLIAIARQALDEM